MPDYSVTFYDGFSSASTYIYSNYDPDGDDEEFYVYLSYGMDYTPDPYYSSAYVSISDPDAAVSPPYVWFDSNVAVDEGYGTEVLLRRDSTVGEVTVSFNAADVTAEPGDYYFMSTGGTGGWATFWDGYDTASDWLYTADDADGDDEQLSIDLVMSPDYYVMGGTWATIEDHEPPVATNNDYFTPEDTAVMGNVLTDDTGNGMDFDPNGDPLSVDPYPMGTPYFGTVTLAADGSFTYTPFSNYCGYDSFGYYVWDNEGGSAYGTVTVTMNPVNDLPEAYGADYMTSEDMTAYGSVMYYDVDGDPLTVGIATGGQPQHGDVQFTDYGSYSNFEYTPEENFHGQDSFSYKVTDPSFATDTATVQLTVTPVNDDPVAAADTVFTEMGQPVTIGDLLVNDTDVDGDMLTISSVDSYSANMGTITDNGDGSVAYTPPLAFTGSDSFTYYVTDNMGGYSMATVSVTIVDGPMVWMDTQPITIAESSSAPITLHRNRSEGDLMVTLYSYGMTAEPEDYWVGGTAWFADGQTEVDILAMINDDADPDDEMFYVGLMDAGSYAIDWNRSQAEVTIEDDDPVTVSLDGMVNVVENEYAIINVSRNTTEGDTTVYFRVVEDSAEAEDYSLSMVETTTAPDGSALYSTTIYDDWSSSSFDFFAEDDDDAEDESMSLQLLTLDGNQSQSGNNSWIAINDDDEELLAQLDTDAADPVNSNGDNDQTSNSTPASPQVPTFTVGPHAGFNANLGDPGPSGNRNAPLEVVLANKYGDFHVYSFRNIQQGFVDPSNPHDETFVGFLSQVEFVPKDKAACSDVRLVVEELISGVTPEYADEMTNNAAGWHVYANYRLRDALHDPLNVFLPNPIEDKSVSMFPAHEGRGQDVQDKWSWPLATGPTRHGTQQVTAQANFRRVTNKTSGTVLFGYTVAAYCSSNTGSVTTGNWLGSAAFGYRVNAAKSTTTFSTGRPATVSNGVSSAFFNLLGTFVNENPGAGNSDVQLPP